MRKPVVDPTADLPASWDVASLGEIALLSPKPDLAQLDENDQVHFVPMAAVAEDFGGLDASQTRRLAEVRKGYTYFSAGDVLLAKITPCMENGKGALVPPLELEHAFGSTEFHVVRPVGAASGKWIAHYLSQPDFRRVARHNMTGTAGQLRVPSKWLAEVGIPIAPRAEQTRIVEKLEELLSDLDAGVAELKAAQRKLAQYRQSLLKAAVEGALTQDWRARHTARETGADLLQRILRERRARWEQKQLAKFAEQGKTPPKDWRDKYPEPVAPDAAGLPELPEGWVWATIDQLAVVGTGVTPLRSNSAYFENGKIPWVTSGALNDEVVTMATEFVTELAIAKCRLDLYPAGSLLVAMYGEGRTRGKCAELSFPATINQAIAALVLEGSAALVRQHIKTFLLDSYEAMRKRASGGVQPNLNLQIIKELAVPLPSHEEQKAIQRRLSEQLDEYRRQDAALVACLRHSAAQRKNLLRAAFAGQLVPQDPRDEPASELLARIRAARAAEGSPRKPRGRRRKETA